VIATRDAHRGCGKGATVRVATHGGHRDDHGERGAATRSRFRAPEHFSSTGLLEPGLLANHRSIDRRRDQIIAGALDWAAVGAAVGVVALVARLKPRVTWPVRSFIGTVLSLALAGLQLGLVAANEETLWRTETGGERGASRPSAQPGPPLPIVRRRGGAAGPSGTARNNHDERISQGLQ